MPHIVHRYTQKHSTHFFCALLKTSTGNLSSLDPAGSALGWLSSSKPRAHVLYLSSRLLNGLKELSVREWSFVLLRHTGSPESSKRAPPLKFLLVLIFNVASSSYKGNFVLRKSSRIQIYLKSVQKRSGTEIKVKIPESDHPVEPSHPSSFELVLVFNAASSSYKGKFILGKSGRIQS